MEDCRYENQIHYWTISWQGVAAEKGINTKLQSKGNYSIPDNHNAG
jgi:hypothetical protein